MNRIAAIYLRVSTEEQARSGYGLMDQERNCRRYANLYFADKEVIVFKDDGYSAKDLNRPKMQEMLSLMKAGKIETIITYKLDRLTRSVVDAYQLINRCVSYDCILVAVMDKLDISSANGRMMVGMLSIISQWEREVISERTKSAMDEMASQGKYPCGRPPFGWKKDENLNLVVNEYEAGIINYMADLYIDGYSIDNISEKVKHKYSIIRKPPSIKKSLLSSANIGHLKFGDKIYENVIMPIMDIEKFNKVNEVYGYRAHHMASKLNYVFHSLVYCKCGCKCEQLSTKKKYNNNTTIYHYYYCPECKKRINQVKLLKKSLLSILCEISYRNLHYRKNELYNEISVIDKNVKELFDSYRTGELDLKTYSYTLSQMFKRKTELNDELENLNITELEDFYNMTITMQYRFLHNIVKRIHVDLEYGDVIKIEYKDK